MNLWVYQLCPSRVLHLCVSGNKILEKLKSYQKWLGYKDQNNNIGEKLKKFLIDFTARDLQEQFFINFCSLAANDSDRFAAKRYWYDCSQVTLTGLLPSYTDTNGSKWNSGHILESQGMCVVWIKRTNFRKFRTFWIWNPLKKHANWKFLMCENDKKNKKEHRMQVLHAISF